MARKNRSEAAVDAESLPALQRRIGIPLFVLVATLVLLAAGDSLHALLQMRSVSTELGRIASVDVAVQSSVRSLVRAQLERHAVLEQALGAAGNERSGARELRLVTESRLAELGQEIEQGLRATRERLAHTGWTREEISRTLRPLVGFEAGMRAVDRAAHPLLARTSPDCDAACERDAAALESAAHTLDLRSFELLEAASL
jgi:hypothetical protein